MRERFPRFHPLKIKTLHELLNSQMLPLVMNPTNKEDVPQGHISLHSRWHIRLYFVHQTWHFCRRSQEGSAATRWATSLGNGAVRAFREDVLQEAMSESREHSTADCTPPPPTSQLLSEVQIFNSGVDSRALLSPLAVKLNKCLVHTEQVCAATTDLCLVMDLVYFN